MASHFQDVQYVWEGINYTFHTFWKYYNLSFNGLVLNAFRIQECRFELIGFDISLF